MNSIKLFAYATKYFVRLRKIDVKKRSRIFSRLYILGAGKKFSSSQNLFSLILRCWQFDHNYKIFIHKQCKFTNEFNKIICIFNKIFCAISENQLQKKDPHLFEAIYPGNRKTSLQDHVALKFFFFIKNNRKFALFIYN